MSSNILSAEVRKNQLDIQKSDARLGKTSQFRFEIEISSFDWMKGMFFDSTTTTPNKPSPVLEKVPSCSKMEVQHNYRHVMLYGQHAPLCKLAAYDRLKQPCNLSLSLSLSDWLIRKNKGNLSTASMFYTLSTSKGKISSSVVSSPAYFFSHGKTTDHRGFFFFPFKRQTTHSCNTQPWGAFGDFLENISIEEIGAERAQ